MNEQQPPATPSLAEHAEEIRALGKRVVGDIIEIGRRLVECKRIAGHGGWLPWLEREFGWRDDTALNFMRVFEMSKSRNFRDLNLPVSGLYLLAKPSTPEPARAEVLNRAQSGEKLNHAQVKEIVAKARKPPADLQPASGESAEPVALPETPAEPENGPAAECAAQRQVELSAEEQAEREEQVAFLKGEIAYARRVRASLQSAFDMAEEMAEKERQAEEALTGLTGKLPARCLSH